MLSHTPTIRAWFDLPACGAQRSPRIPTPPPPPPGQILWITGPSGSGKSSLLKQMRCQSRPFWIDVNRITLPNRPVIDCFDHQPLRQTLILLSRLGLADACIYLRLPRRLSAGQRFRLRLALAFGRSAQVTHAILACDEFASNLDPLTAGIAARCLRRAIAPYSSICAVLASARDDLLAPLAPDQTIFCDFGSWNYVHPRRQTQLR